MGATNVSCYRLSSRSSKQATSPSDATAMSTFHLVLVGLLVIAISAILLLHAPSASILTSTPTVSGTPFFSYSSGYSVPESTTTWSGDLRVAEFSWNRLPLNPSRHPPESLKIAVFSRKWPVDSSPGGMERHAMTLHSALARRGHEVHVFTSGATREPPPAKQGGNTPVVHFLPGTPNQWRPDEAWAMFQQEQDESGRAFDAIHSESVALPHRLAKGVPNIAVTWHGIALEVLQSALYQDLALGHDPLGGIIPSGSDVNSSAADHQAVPVVDRGLPDRPGKVLAEIRFFHSYTHHIAISDSAGDMLRDVYQIPSPRVHVILNGVDDKLFRPDPAAGRRFRETHGIPSNATLVLGVAGRLVRDKGHPLLYPALAELASRHPGVFLVVAGSGPWAKRYADLGPTRAVVAGALSPTDLAAFYNAVDVFVNPTLRPQGLDLTLMEAMRCGTPVAATRFPSIRGSVVVDSELGHLFAPNPAAVLETLERVVAEGRERLKERGRRCARYAEGMFSAVKMAMAYERLFLCIKNGTYCTYPLAFD